MQKILYYLLMVIAATAVAVPVAYAESSEYEGGKTVWSCAEYPIGKKAILWLVEWGDKSYVKVFDERIPAIYYIDGIKKRWDWEEFSIVLNPDGGAAYYDFRGSANGTARARELYKCSK